MIIGLDTETERFGPGNMAPRLVCVSLYAPDPCLYDSHLVHQSQVDNEMIEHYLDHEIVGQNIAYDMAVLCRHSPESIPAIYQAYSLNRIHDTMIREQLIDLSKGNYQPKAKGRYTLQTLAKNRLGVELDKDTYRLNYGDLIDVPLDQWSEGARAYALDDAKVALQVAEHQDAQMTAADERNVLDNAPAQAAYAFAYQLLTCWGMVTDARRVLRLKRETQAHMADLRKLLIASGLMKVQAKGKHAGKVTRDLKATRTAVLEAYGGDAPLTEKGNVSTSRETIIAHPKLKLVSDYMSLQKLDSTYIRVLEEGINGGVIHGKFHLASTGRRAANKNMQTPPREGDVRECYVPRSGYVFGTIDYNSLELRAWAQVMVNLFGLENVPMAKMYRADPDADPHTKFGAEFFLKISYEDGLRRLRAGDAEVKKARQYAKAFNFGIPGGLGVKTFIKTAFVNYGVELSEAEAKKGIVAWKLTWNAQQYFDYIAYHAENYGWIEQMESKRIRGGLGYCDMANSYFQGLAADGHARALFNISRECYAVPQSPLFGSRVVNALHDEFILELLRRRASAALLRAERLMVEGMESVLPDVPARTEGALMPRWMKGAKRIVLPDGSVGVCE
jgi:DNA polymerase I-like protein with 3'-5' exonuclease and polymerase domains